jgi:hypothetical protein
MLREQVQTAGLGAELYSCSRTRQPTEYPTMISVTLSEKEKADLSLATQKYSFFANQPPKLRYDWHTGWGLPDLCRESQFTALTAAKFARL